MPITLQPHPSASTRSKSAILLEAALSLLPRLQGSLTRAMLIEHLAEVAGSSAHPFSIRDAFEMLECACVMHMMRAGPQAGEGPAHLLPWLIELYQRLPTQTVRSEVQVKRADGQEGRGKSEVWLQSCNQLCPLRKPHHDPACPNASAHFRDGAMRPPQR